MGVVSGAVGAYRAFEWAATAVFQFGASDLGPGTVVEFRKPWFGKITTASCTGRDWR